MTDIDKLTDDITTMYAKGHRINQIEMRPDFMRTLDPSRHFERVPNTPLRKFMGIQVTENNVIPTPYRIVVTPSERGTRNPRQ